MLRVMDAPGFYAAFPWGGSNMPFYILHSLSPRIYLHLAVYSGTVAISSEQYTEGLHRSVPARGAVLYTGLSRPCIEHKWAPFDEKHLHK